MNKKILKCNKGILDKKIIKSAKYNFFLIDML